MRVVADGKLPERPRNPLDQYTVTKNAKLTMTSRLTVRVVPRQPDFNGKFLYRYAPPTGAVPNASSSTLYIPLYRYK